ncbi:MAG TPA: small ribosomal subunit Rsm22 family protein [Chlamydiales bacterium]|nr:small ribosomal subunit Rsm22 family protein [Chlamydiales bacterium]
MNILPDHIQTNLEALLQGISTKELHHHSQKLSDLYRQGLPTTPLLKGREAHLAYLITRLPATYAAVFEVLQRLLKVAPQFRPKTILDVGAGPGTGIMAASEIYGPLAATLIERDEQFIQLGKKLLQDTSNWINQSFTDLPLDKKYDVVMMSYSLGEASQEVVSTVVDRLFQITQGAFIVVEPGTPRGYETIMKVRSRLIKTGAHLLAPCPHVKPCPIPPGDWCHFSTRLPRTRLHRFVKGVSLGYEDEKFSYIIASPTMQNTAIADRVIRAPEKRSNHISMTLCTHEGDFEKKTIFRSEKELFVQAKRADWGDQFSSK